MSARRILMMPDFREANPYQTLLAQSLRQEGIETVFSAHRPGRLPFFRTWLGAGRPKVLHLHWLNPYWRGDTLLTRTHSTILILFDLLLLRLCGVRIVWTAHNLFSHECAFPRLERLLNSGVARLSARLFAHSRSSRKQVSEAFGVSRRKIVLIHHGHYRDYYKPAMDQIEARRRLNLPVHGRVFLFFGILRQYKGLEKLIQAWEDVEPALRGDHLLIAGKPGYAAYGQGLRHRLESCQSATLIDRHITDAEIPVFFSAADVVVLPFQRILTSGSLLLAMSYGKPVIAPRFPGVEETVGEATQLLYFPQDRDGLKTSLQRASRTELRRLSKMVIGQCDQYGWKEIARTTARAYSRQNAPRSGISRKARR